MISRKDILKQYGVNILLWVLIIGFGLFGFYRLAFIHFFDFIGVICVSWGAFFIQVRETEKYKSEYRIAQNMLSMIEAKKPGSIDEATAEYLKMLEEMIDDND